MKWTEPEAQKIAEKLRDNGFEVYVVGGYVRDLLLKIESSDIDLVTNAKPDELESLFSKDNINCVGTNFKVTIINNIEVATYRKDYYSWDSIRLDHVGYADTIEEDLSRRDLTINAMALDPFTDEIIDPFGGKKDIKDKLIKFVGTPVIRIHEDPIRIIRACRFLALIDGKFDVDTFEAMRGRTYRLTNSPRERFQIEIMKAMKAEKASKFFNALRHTGLLQMVFGQAMFDMIGLDGGPHHNETVWEHSMMCGDAIKPNNAILKLSGYLHDIGKPLAYKLCCDGHFTNHHRVGIDIAKEVLSDLKFTTEQINFVCDCVYFHMSNLDSYAHDKTFRRLLNKIASKKKSVTFTFEDLIDIRIADRKANKKVTPDNNTTFGGFLTGSSNIFIGSSVPDTKEALLERFDKIIACEQAFSIKDLNINGHDVMEIMNIPPSPEVKFYLDTLLEIVLNEPELNNREDLITKLKEIDYDGNQENTSM